MPPLGKFVAARVATGIIKHRRSNSDRYGDVFMKLGCLPEKSLIWRGLSSFNLSALQVHGGLGLRCSISRQEIFWRSLAELVLCESEQSQRFLWRLAASARPAATLTVVTEQPAQEAADETPAIPGAHRPFNEFIALYSEGKQPCNDWAQRFWNHVQTF
jgi:hypothetical protein